MATLSAEEIKGYASKAGFKGQDLNIAVAVALAESTGNTKAHNPRGKDDSYGLWQINLYGDMGPARRREFALASDADLFQPDVNAKAAYKIFKSQGWQRGWTTYSSGKYKKFLPEATAAVAKEPRDGIEDKIYDAARSPIDGVGNAINAFGTTLFKGVANLTGIGIAVAFLAVGVTFLIMSSNGAKKAANIAANVVPGGAAVKGALKKVNKA